MGKSGPFTHLSRSFVSSFLSLMSSTHASISSPALCGGMLVAMPTAMPVVPFISSCGSFGGQHDRLLRVAVVRGAEVDRLARDLREQIVGDAREASLGVTEGGRSVAVERAEVAVAVDERVAQREVLREANERVVDRRVAVRVELTHHATDDVRALLVLGVERDALVPHAVQNSALHRLEAVTHVGQRARGDDAQRVVEVPASRFVGELNGLLVSTAARTSALLAATAAFATAAAISVDLEDAHLFSHGSLFHRLSRALFRVFRVLQDCVGGTVPIGDRDTRK